MSRPIRSLLALLGLAVAIVGMVGLFSVAAGIDEMVADTFGRIPGLVALQPGAPIPLFSVLPASWADEIRGLQGVHVVNRETWGRVHIIEGKPIVSPPRFLFGTEIPTTLRLDHSVYRDALKRGRFLTPRDRGTLHTVISQQIAEEFGKGLEDTLHVDGNELTIVGIYECGSLLLDIAIILDIDQARAITRFDQNSVSAIYIEPDPGVDDAQLKEQIRSHFRGRGYAAWQPPSGLTASGDLGQDSRGVLDRTFSILFHVLKAGGVFQRLPNPSPNEIPGDHVPSASLHPVVSEKSVRGKNREAAGRQIVSRTAAANVPKNPAGTEEPPIEVRTADDWAERIDSFKADLDIFLIIMTAIGVTVAVLSIVNTMLMSVTERIVEFGILKANGWSNGDVVRLITFESALLGVAGGLIGCVFGWLGTKFVNWHWATKVYLFASPKLLVFSVLFAAGVGILGGLYPAIWATRMSPMNAIRRG